MSDAKQDKRVLVDVRKMSDEELDAAIDSALDELFGGEEPQEKRPSRTTKRSPAANGPVKERVVGLLRSIQLDREQKMTEEQRTETRKAFREKIDNVKKGTARSDKE